MRNTDVMFRVGSAIFNMHIIAGKLKGRVIEMPKGIRPTSDKVRNALFEILKCRIEGADFLDLYCGSGAVGIEAFSRGAKSVTFVDNNPKCIATLKRNLGQIGVLDLCCSIGTYKRRFLPPFRAGLEGFSPLSLKGLKPLNPQLKLVRRRFRAEGDVTCITMYNRNVLDRDVLGTLLKMDGETVPIIFLDPPYCQDIAKNTLIAISGCDILAPDTVIVAEVFKKEILPEEIGVLRKMRVYKYGDTRLEFYRYK